MCIHSLSLQVPPHLIVAIFFLQTEQYTQFGSQADKRHEILDEFLLMLETTTVQIILRIQKQVSRTKAFSLRHPEESRADL